MNYTANHHEIETAYTRAVGFLDEWANAASISGTTRAKIDAAEAIGLNLVNLPNFSREEAIGFAEALLRDFADAHGLVEYHGIDPDTIA